MNKELKVGVIAIISLAVLYVGVNYLKGFNVLNESRVYYAKYDNIGGLTSGSSVFLNGYQVGMVSDINLLNHENQQLLITINIDQDFDIPVNTICKIVNQDLMGSKSINLILGNDVVLAKYGDTLMSDIQSSLQDEVNAQILPLKLKTEELLSSIDSVMMIVTAVLNKDARENLRNTLKSLDETFDIMNQTMIKVDQVIDNNDDKISSIIKNLNDNNENISSILNNLSEISDDIAKSNIKNLLNTLALASNKISNAEGSLGLLINDKELYFNLQKSSKELENLIKDIKENPKRYLSFSIIGGKSKPNKNSK